MNKLDALEQVRQLLDTPSRWTTESSARDRFGNKISPDSIKATCWCLTGAVNRICGRDVTLELDVRYMLADSIIALALSENLGGRLRDSFDTVYIFNDSSTYEEVINLLDVTIVAEQQALVLK